MKKAEQNEKVECTNCSSKLPSVAFCHQCSEYICTKCVEAHKHMRQFSTHKVVSIESLRTASSFPVVEKEVHCSKHRDEKLKLYCYDCRKLVCRDCVLIDHKDHMYKFVEEAASQCKFEIMKKVESVKKISVDLESAVKGLNDSEKMLSAHCTATMKAIDNALDRIAFQLMQKRKQLKEETQRMVNKAKEEIKIQGKTAQLAVGEVESLLEFMNRNLEKATDQEVLSLEKQMTDQVERVSQLYRNPTGKFPVPQIPQFKVYCSPKVEQVIGSDIKVVKENAVNIQPLAIPIDPMIARCMQENFEGLQTHMSSIHVTCTLKQDTNETTVSVSPTKLPNSDWKEECKHLFSSYIGREYLRETIEIPKVAVKEVFQILFSTQTKGCFIVESSDDGSSATIAGKRSVVNSVCKRINNICSEMQTSESISFKPREYDFFTQIVQQSLDSKDTTIACSPDSHSIEVSGSIRDVSVTVKLIMEAVQHVVVPVMVDECIVHFITTEGKQDLEIAIQRKRIKAAIHTNMDVQPPTLELLCHKQYTQKVESLAESFPKKIETMTLQLPETITESPVSHEFQDHYQKLAKEYHVSIRPRQDELQICGFKNKVDEAKKAMEKYIKQKCTITRSFPIQKGMWRLLCGAMRPKWSKIQTDCSDKDVVIKRPSDEEEKCIITLRGDKVQVLKIIESMNRLVQSVQTAVIPLVSPEIRRYFKEGEDGGMKIPGIEINARVYIEICKVGEETTCIFEEDDIDSEQPKMKCRSSVPRLSKQCTAQVVDMKRITIYVGDITEVRVDVIVNAANEELKHIGGVADAILKKGGQEIQVASDHYVRSHGRLTAGEVWLSPVVGKLPCLALVHAVGPRWHSNPSGKQLLKKVYMNCLKTASAYTSIALPAISSGIHVFDCPLNQCAEIAISTNIVIATEVHL